MADNIPASIWPLIKSGTMFSGSMNNMPFSENFWHNYEFHDNGILQEVKGYFTTLPIRWSEEENNMIPYNIRLIANNNALTSNTQLLAGNSDWNGNEEHQA